jgi:exopolysaccharide biosynthesis polyprenyl glycosylphosphotransferase
MKKSELFFSFLLVPLDFLMIVLAGISAFYLRFAEFTIEMRPAIFNIQFSEFLKVVSVVAFLWLIIFALSGLYNIKGSRRIIKEFYRVILACSTGLMLIVAIIFLSRELFESRFIVLTGWGLAIFYVSSARALVRGIQRYIYRYDIGVHKLVIVGNSKTADRLIHEFSRSKNSGFRVIKRFRDFSLETSQELFNIINNREVDEVVQCDPNLSKSETLRLFDFADEHHLTFKYAADLLGAKVLQTEVMEIAGIPIVEVKKTPLDGWGRIIKRLFDLFFASMLLIILLPVLLITAIIIKIDSRGPVFYLDYRTGQFGKKFLFYKFRSMAAHLCDGEGPHATIEGNKMLNELLDNAEKNTRNNQPLHKIKDDPRVTKFGKFIRRWSLDELPQLINVIKGDISLVGPRPHMTLETMRYEKHHKKVLTIKPGITGLAQISGRSDLSFEEEVKLDTYYIENWSMLLDISILFRTPLAVVKKRKVE